LDRHADGSVNFHTKLMAGTGLDAAVERRELKGAIRELFDGDGEVSLLYFAGHGHTEATGGYLCTSDSRSRDDGLALAEVMTLAHDSKARNRIIVLDSCFSGNAGNNPVKDDLTELKEGMTILAASTANQYASEENGSGVFTNLFVDALGGGAANLVGDVTPGAVYAHVDQALGAWAQRPVFKTNVKSFVSLRKVQPPLQLADLRRIAEFFPEPGYHYQLDPSFEPEPAAAPAHVPDPDKNAIFSILQKYNRVNLLVPEGAPHMWHAAMESKTVRLTALGEHYRKLAAQNLL
jgi:Caspase domain